MTKEAMNTPEVRASDIEQQMNEIRLQREKLALERERLALEREQAIRRIGASAEAAASRVAQPFTAVSSAFPTLVKAVSSAFRTLVKLALLLGVLGAIAAGWVTWHEVSQRQAEKETQELREFQARLEAEQEAERLRTIANQLAERNRVPAEAQADSPQVIAKKEATPNEETREEKEPAFKSPREAYLEAKRECESWKSTKWFNNGQPLVGMARMWCEKAEELQKQLEG